MKYHVVVQPQAQDDVRSIYLWLAERAPEGASRWFEQWLAAVTQLADSPGRFGLALESGLVTAEIRQVNFRTRHGRLYRAIFSIDGSVVNVLHVRGPGQSPLTKRDLT